MFPEMFGYENTLYEPRGKTHEVFGKFKRKFCCCLKQYYRL